jgi:hypothetical protein
MLWELFVSPESSFCFALLPFVLSPFASPWRVGSLEHFVSVVLSRCPCLRGLRLLVSSNLILPFLWLLITCLRSLVCFFSFSFSYELVTMCVVSALIKGEIEDRSVWRQVDGRSLVWWVIDNAVWTDSWPSIVGAGCAWFALVQVKSGHERF